jgi:hypothetical protein
MKVVGRRLKFPNPNDYAAKHPVVLCPADRVLGLYEQATGKRAARIAKNLKAWFTNEAKQKGWAGCRFVPEVQSVHGAGAMLLNPLSTKIEVQQIIIQLPKPGDQDNG